MNSRISGVDLRLTIGTTRALDGTSIAVAPAEIVAVMGPSGAGKSTLLHCLAGILRPDQGEVRYGERRLDLLPERERSRIRLHHFGFVFQFGELVPELTLRENIRLPLQLTRSDPGLHARVGELLEELELTNVASQRATEVSAGQAQRAAVGRALVHRPEVIFADEPTGALDTVTGELVLKTLVRLARQQGTSVILVTHDHRVAAYADREIVVRDGSVVTTQVPA